MRREDGIVELKKEDIQILRTKSKASSQVTFDVDYNVPDVKPDIGRMIQNKGEMRQIFFMSVRRMAGSTVFLQIFQWKRH